MMYTWLIKILSIFSKPYRSKKIQQEQKSASTDTLENTKKTKTITSYESSMLHIFSPPLKLCMLRKIRCRVRSKELTNNHTTIPSSIALLEHQVIARFLNNSQNCANKSCYESTDSITQNKKYPSLIAINIDNNDSLKQSPLLTYVNRLSDIDRPIDQLKLNNKNSLNR